MQTMWDVKTTTESQRSAQSVIQCTVLAMGGVRPIPTQTAVTMFQMIRSVRFVATNVIFYSFQMHAKLTIASTVLIIHQTHVPNASTCTIQMHQVCVYLSLQNIVLNQMECQTHAFNVQLVISLTRPQEFAPFKITLDALNSQQI